MDPVALGMMALMGTVAIGAVGGAIWWNARETQRRNEVWSAVARERGGTFSDGHFGMLSTESPVIEAVVQHAVVRIELFFVQAGKSRQIYTRARASYTLAAGPIFKVYREGVLQSVGKALGAQDVELGGDEPFDLHFVVKCDDPQATRDAWTPRAKDLMRRHFEGDRAESDGREVTVTVWGSIVDPRKLHLMLELAGALASAGTSRLADYAALEGAALQPASGTYEQPVAPRLTFETVRGEVRVELLAGIGVPRVRLRLPHERELPPFSVDVEDGEAAGLPRGLVSERAHELFRRIPGPLTLAGDRSGLQLTWRTAPSPEVLVEGVRLIAELAGGTPTEGAFR